MSATNPQPFCALTYTHTCLVQCTPERELGNEVEVDIELSKSGLDSETSSMRDVEDNGDVAESSNRIHFELLCQDSIKRRFSQVYDDQLGWKASL